MNTQAPTCQILQSKQKQLDLSQPVVMAILNVTPDSFSDGGQYQVLASAVARAKEMIAAGVAIIDVGGESTRPGATEVSLQEELERTIPVIQAIRAISDVWISIDTSKAEVMRQAVAAGADMINDVRALTEPEALQAALASEVPICLMHMQGQPQSMQENPRYQHLLDDVAHFLKQRIAACEAVGIPTERLLLDPGFGFGKTLEHNYLMLDQLERFHQLGLPLLVGLSRKSMIFNLLNRSANDSVAGSIACATIAAQKGAQIIRVHDFHQTIDALKIVNKLSSLGVRQGL